MYLISRTRPFPGPDARPRRRSPSGPRAVEARERSDPESGEANQDAVLRRFACGPIQTRSSRDDRVGLGELLGPGRGVSRAEPRDVRGRDPAVCPTRTRGREAPEPRNQLGQAVDFGPQARRDDLVGQKVGDGAKERRQQGNRNDADQEVGEGEAQRETVEDETEERRAARASTTTATRPATRGRRTDRPPHPGGSSRRRRRAPRSRRRRARARSASTCAASRRRHLTGAVDQAPRRSATIAPRRDVPPPDRPAAPLRVSPRRAPLPADPRARTTRASAPTRSSSSGRGPGRLPAAPEVRFLAQAASVFLPPTRWRCSCSSSPCRWRRARVFGRGARRSGRATAAPSAPVFSVALPRGTRRALVLAARSPRAEAPGRHARGAPARGALRPSPPAAAAVVPAAVLAAPLALLRRRAGRMSAPSRPIVVLDFGSQYTQLIARRIREARVFSVVLPGTASAEEIRKWNPAGIILSGGRRASTRRARRCRRPTRARSGVPTLGLCYGMQWMAQAWGGRGRRREGTRVRPGGRAPLAATRSSSPGLEPEQTVWMSHGDTDRGAARRASASSARRASSPIAAFENADERLYASAVPSGGPPHRARLGDPARTSSSGSAARGPTGRWRPSAQEKVESDPRAGSRGRRHLRPFGRRGFLGDGDPPARGAGRPRPPDPRGPRPHAGARAPAGRGGLPAPRHRDPRRGRVRPLPGAAVGRRRPGGEAPDHRPDASSRSSSGRPGASRTPATWRRGRSIRTSSSRSRSRGPPPSSRRTTTSAACRRSSASS